MKKVLLLFLAIILGHTMVNAQNTAIVDLMLDSASSTEFTVSFDKNDNCTFYNVLITEEGGLDQWIQMMGATIPMLVDQWGIHCYSDTTITFRDQIPGTRYYIYANAHGSVDSLCYIVINTSGNGGTGVSEITITIPEVTATSARVICTPNEETSMFKDMLIEQSYFDTMQRESVIALLQEGLYPQYEVDDWLWMDLKPNTGYYALAMGQNANGEWGTLAIESFTTLAQNAIESPENVAFSFSVYPNPVKENATLEFAQPTKSETSLILFDFSGRRCATFPIPEATIRYTLPLAKFPAGIYLLKCATEEGNVAVPIIKQ